MGHDALNAKTTCYGGLIGFHIYAVALTKEYNHERGIAFLNYGCSCNAFSTM